MIRVAGLSKAEKLLDRMSDVDTMSGPKANEHRAILRRMFWQLLEASIDDHDDLAALLAWAQERAGKESAQQ